MTNQIVLLTLNREMAEYIFNGVKKYEYRKSAPKTPLPVRAIIYIPEDVKSIVGEVFIDEIITQPVRKLIRKTIRETPHSKQQIRNYFHGYDIGHALKVSNPKRYSRGITLEELKSFVPDFLPQQNFRYINPEKDKFVGLLQEIDELK